MRSIALLKEQKEPAFDQFIFELFGCKLLERCEVVSTSFNFILFF